MREIKFRYIWKRISDGNIWIEIVPIECIEGAGDTPFILHDQQIWKLLSRDLFTGLIDNKNVEIYKGDILSTLAHSEKIRKNPKYLKVVEWIGAGFNIRNGKGFEIIGNIMENKELLEKK